MARGGIMTEKLRAREKILEAERDILRAMVQGTPERSVWAEGVELLADYAFEDSTHQLIFDTLRELATADPALIRERLPARLNNKGFPDTNLEALFQPHNLTATQAVALMRALRSQTLGRAR
jgi:replicative DNA helicase